MGAALIWIICALAAVAQSQRAPPERVVLLPSQDGRASAVIIVSAAGQTVLEQPYLSAAIARDGAVTTASETADTVQLRYAATLAALPQRAAVFLLYFDTATEALVPESAARLEQIKLELAKRPAPEIIVIGHTDTVDTSAYNDELSLRRALAVKQMLVEVGIAADSISASGRGEREPLVPTRDRVDEPRNRRVEIRVR
ncbi:OmpA family protein [Rugamonas sp. CCM 8940]|uniref:OmpA family protein n=1 Tax=Rugamonas sp. CCM 8940 TaxID=2765359 RepID=UPI0018F6AC8E|nr:OmpA family protein [Rugamonas sp. CCM 8940]MBJ7310909.1 OmpA family protein [Rugamonas sp. CCM 8940]